MVLAWGTKEGVNTNMWVCWRRLSANGGSRGGQQSKVAVVGRLYSIQYKSIFGVPDKVRQDMCDKARLLSQV